MEKKTKLTITLAFAVLLISLLLGTAISTTPNANDAQTAAPIQPEIEESQFGAPPTKTCCLATASGILRVSPPKTIYETTTDMPPHATILATITCTSASAMTEGKMTVGVDGTEYDFYAGSSLTIYGKPERIYVQSFTGLGWALGNYEIIIVEPQ